MHNSGKNIKRLAWSLGLLQLFIGIGALGGGLGLVMEPSGAGLEMPLELLEHSPFSDFLIPGLFLLVVNGLGNIAGGVLSFRLSGHASRVALFLGGFLVVWILIQVYWLQSFHWLHALYLILGVIESVLGWKLLRVTVTRT